MSIVFKYGLKSEKKRLYFTFKRLKWYRSKGYGVSLPYGVNLANLTKKELASALKKEYNSKEYEKVASFLKKKLAPIEKKYLSALKLLGRVRKEYIVVLTKYGTGGTYYPPSKVVVKINHPPSLVETIVHEICHILIQKDIDKYKIEHWEKERIVDMILCDERFKVLHYGKYTSKLERREYAQKKYLEPLFEKYFFTSKKKFYESIKRARHSG